MKRKQIECIQGILYILPSLVLLVSFCIIPIFMSGYFSFTNYNVMTPPQFTGFANYLKILEDEYMLMAAKNTLLYVLMTVPLQTVLALLFAAFIAHKLYKKKLGQILRSVMFIPVIASAVTAGSIWRVILATEGGILNTLLSFVGIDPINWLGSSQTALISIGIVAVWKHVGYFLVIYYAGIMGIPKELFEAAKVDGAGAIQQFFEVTIPMLRPITYLVVTLGIIWSFQVFDLSFLMTGGGPGHSSVTIVMGIYNAAFKQYRIGYACAIAMVLLLVISLINILQNRFFAPKEDK